MEMPTAPMAYSEFVLFTLRGASRDPNGDKSPALIQHNKARYVQYSIGSEIVQLQIVCKQNPANERMKRKREVARKKALKAYPLISKRCRHLLNPRDLSISLHNMPISNQGIQISSSKRRSLPAADHLCHRRPLGRPL